MYYMKHRKQHSFMKWNYITDHMTSNNLFLLCAFKQGKYTEQWLIRKQKQQILNQHCILTQ
jgi:hypothetical protein